MEKRVYEIIDKLNKIKQDKKKGAILNDSFSELYNDMDFLIDELHKSNERIKKLERIIVDDRISHLKEP